MLCRRALYRCCAAISLLAVSSAKADPITLTGNVANDFQASNPTVANVLANDPNVQYPIHIGEQPWQVQEGLASGWNIKAVMLSYDKATDTMYVGVSTYGGYAGDIVGNGGQPDPHVQYGADPPNFGLDKSITLGFAAANSNATQANPPNPVIVAGVPGPKSGPGSEAGPGLDGFNVATYNSGGGGSSSQSAIYNLPGGYGQTLTAGMGNLAFNPDPSHPGFEFTITNFSKISGLDPTKQSLWIEAYAGSEQTQIAGKDFEQGIYPVLSSQTVPEPATCLVWSLLAAGLLCHCRKRVGSK